MLTPDTDRPAAGDPAPAFSLPAQDGRTHALADYAGRWLVLWWYPKAGSEKCSIQGRELAPRMDDFAAEGAAIVGVSFNDGEENKDFAACENISFPLLSDVDRAVGKAYGVDRPADDPFPDSARRVTFVIDPAGVIAGRFQVTDVMTHAEDALTELRRLTADASTGGATS